MLYYKNNTQYPLTFNSIDIEDVNIWHELDPETKSIFLEDEDILKAINNKEIVLKDGDGTILDVPNAMRHLYSNVDIPLSKNGKQNKVAVHISPKPELPGKTFYSVWSSSGDDPINHVFLGGEDMIFIASDNDTEIVKEFYVDKKFGLMYISEGAISWQGCQAGDMMNVEMIVFPTPVVPVAPGEAGVITVDSDGFIHPSTNGTHKFAGLPSPIYSFHKNGDWDFDGVNLTPSQPGKGKFKLNVNEVVMSKFFNDIYLIGNSNGYLEIKSDDNMIFPFNAKLRLTLKKSTGHSCVASIFLTLFREMPEDI